MLYEQNYLMHYGIKGQKWGVRRFQNEDGSLTAEGKKRYAKSINDRFQKTSQSVRSNLSNKKVPVERKSIDIEEVMRRGKLSPNEAEKCASIAKRMYDKSVVIEPRITNDVVNAVSLSGGTMYGLEYRLKQPTSLAAKIGADAKASDISFADAARSINDQIRYTSVSDDDRFVENYKSTQKILLDNGYREIRCKNYFDLYRQGKVQHKSLQCVFADPNGNRFEIQFQTPSSQAVKNMKIPLYNEIRNSGVSSQRRAEIERQMREMADMIPFPKNIEDIRSF